MIDWSKPVQTRDKRAVRILCIDGGGILPVIGILRGHVTRWRSDGKWLCNAEWSSNNDLMNVPPPKRTKTLWWFLYEFSLRGKPVLQNYTSECSEFNDNLGARTLLAKKEITITEGEGL